MRISIVFIVIIATTFSALSQYTVRTNAAIENAHLAASINTSTANANLTVMIGENLNSRNFSIGFTDLKSDADVVITDNASANDLIIVKSRLSEAGLSVKYGEKLINPSVKIELIENGTVDYLIYNESESFDIEALILALLPIINANIGYPYDVIPYWGPEGSPTPENQPEQQVFEPVQYDGINIARWISTIEEGIIQLDDNTLFYVYNEDRYMSKLWQVKNDVVVTPTEVFGHYYITKDGGIYKEAETLRAICFRVK